MSDRALYLIPITGAVVILQSVIVAYLADSPRALAWLFTAWPSPRPLVRHWWRVMFVVCAAWQLGIAWHILRDSSLLVCAAAWFALVVVLATTLPRRRAT